MFRFEKGVIMDFSFDRLCNLAKEKEKGMAISKEEILDRINDVASAVKNIDIGTEKIQSMLKVKKQEEENDGTEILKLILKILAAVAIGALIAFAIYHFLKPDYLSDFDDDIDDDFEDDFFADEDEDSGKA